MTQDDYRRRIDDLRPPPPDRTAPSTSSLLSIFLAGGAGLVILAVLFFLFAPLGGIVLGVIALMFILATYAFLHFVVWGWWLGGVIRSEVATEERLEAAQLALPRPEAVTIPVSLQVVAALFILSGIWALLQILIIHSLDYILLDLTLLGLVIGPGLLHRGWFWRPVAVVWLVLELAGAVWVTAPIAQAPGPFDVWILSQNLGQITKSAALTLVAGALLLFAWQFWVLLRADVRKLFVRADSTIDH